MPHLNAEAKHAILLEYTPRSTTHGYTALARRHSVKGGARTIQRWHSRWDGTPHSLEHEPTPGRPRILTPAEVSRHVRATILAANRAHRAVSYTQLLPEVRRKTGKAVSIQTLRRVGHEQLGATRKHTRKRTADERECTHACESERACVCRVCGADK